MRKLLVPLCIIGLLLFAAMSAHADTLITANVESVTTFLDTNGDMVARVIVTENKNLQGHDYTVGTPVMAFREHVEMVQDLKAGDTLKAICAMRVFNGRTSYVILKVIP